MSLVTRKTHTHTYTHTQKKWPWEDREKEAICKLKSEASEETKPADTLILDFQPPELWENKCLLLKPPSHWYLVMISVTDYLTN